MATKATTTAVDLSAIPLQDEEESRQFVLCIDGHRVRMEYDRSSDRIFLTHLIVPPALEGQGVEVELTERVLNWAEGNRMKVVPYCQFVKDYLRKNTAWQRLLLKGVEI